MLAFLFAILPQPVDLDRLDLERARAISGRLVVASFIVAKPIDIHRTFTNVGAADEPDGAERGALLRGKRFDVDEGKRVELVGQLRVTDYKPAVVGGVFVPAWVGVTVMESLPR